MHLHAGVCVIGVLAEKLAQGGVFQLVDSEVVLNMTTDLVIKAGTLCCWNKILMHMHTCAHKNTCVPSHIHAHVITCMQAHAPHHARARMHACTHARMHACTYTKIGTPVLFYGRGRTINTGPFHFHVKANAKFCLYNAHLINGKVLLATSCLTQ